jgi:hypothetical protein
LVCSREYELTHHPPFHATRESKHWESTFSDKISKTLMAPILHSLTKKDIVSFREPDSTILDSIFTADYDSVLEFFPARQDFEIIGLLSVKNGFYCNI